MNANTNGACGSGHCGCGSTRHPVASAAAAMLDQCAAFVRGIPGSTYSVESETLKGGTIGKHVRHTLDHYRAALASGSGLVIDYDRRDREVPMETQPEEALRAIESLRQQVLALDHADLAAQVRIRVMVSGDGIETELESTLARELAFVTHHAVHHHAMLGAMAREHGVIVGSEFGKAPSTVNHESTGKAAALR